MGLVSRVFGGMRTSDLHAWRWEHIDTTAWKTAKIRRPKVRGLTLIELPTPLLPWLQLWWRETGSRKAGPVFPVGRGERAAEHRGHTGYARQLRSALLAAGVTRAELHADDTETKRVDFHSFRRAFTTALMDADVVAQKAMKLAGHTKMETHMRYVDRIRALKTPDAVVPSMGQLEATPQTTKAPKSSDSEALAAGRTGLEPAASGVTGRRYNQLNYHPVSGGGVHTTANGSYNEKVLGVSRRWVRGRRCGVGAEMPRVLGCERGMRSCAGSTGDGVLWRPLSRCLTY